MFMNRRGFISRILGAVGIAAAPAVLLAGKKVDPDRYVAGVDPADGYSHAGMIVTDRHSGHQIVYRTDRDGVLEFHRQMRLAAEYYSDMDYTEFLNQFEKNG